MSQNSNTQCSNCGRTKMKFDVFTIKCSEHSYILCNPCTRKQRNDQCPECKTQKESNNGILTNKSQGLASSALYGNGKGVKIEERGQLKKIMKDILSAEQENRLLLKEKNSLERELSQKDIQLKNMQLQIYKIKEQAKNQIEQIKLEHVKEIAKLQEKFNQKLQTAIKKLKEENQEKILKISKENQNLINRIQAQKLEINKNFELQKQLLLSNFSNEKQALIIDLQTKNNQELQAAENRMKEKTKAFQTELQSHKTRHESSLEQLKVKFQQEKEQLISSFRAQKQEIKTKFAEQTYKMQQDFELQKDLLILTYQRENGQLKGSFLQEKGNLQQKLQKNNQDLQDTIEKGNQQKKAIREQHEMIQAHLKSKLKQYQILIQHQKQQLQKSSTQILKLTNYIQSQGKSLVQYNRELNELEQYLQKNTDHIIAQFKYLDQSYIEVTPDKVKQIQLTLKQYRSVVEATQHPVLRRIIADKETLVTNYIEDFLKKFDQNLQDIEVDDIFHLESQRGKKLKRVIQKIDLARTLENKNINETIQKIFFPRLFSKFRQILVNFNEQISSYSKDISEFELIKQIDNYYLFADYIYDEFPHHKQACSAQYQALNQTINIVFNRFQQTYKQIKSDKPAQKLEDYLANTERLKRFIQILQHSKEYHKYTQYLQRHTKMKVKSIKSSVLATLNSNKKGLKKKLDSLIQSRVYFDCFLYQKIFKKLKVFDQILTKQENSLYHFNFTQLYNKILNILKILKEEKLNLVDVIITEDKITMSDLEKELSAIAFDQSIKNRYLYKIKNVLQSRSGIISKITPNSLVSNKDLQRFELFFMEAQQLKDIKYINEVAQLQDQFRLFENKIPILLAFIDRCFGIYYSNSLQFKELQETSRNIKHYNQFQAFAQEHFPRQHQQFKGKILKSKHYQLPQLQAEDELAFNLLFRYNFHRSELLKQAINTPEQPLKEEHFQFYTNMVKYLSKGDASKLQSKLHKSVDLSIIELEGKEWLQGQTSSLSQRKLIQRVSKLQNKEIAYYRELIAAHKNKVMDERQKIVNNQKRRLKEDDYQSLQLFLEECKKHQKNNKFYKLYINILEDHINSSYDSISENVDKKINFLQNIYKIKLHNSTSIIQDIFKNKEYKIYFCRPQLLTVRGNISLIERFEGESEGIILKACEMLLNPFRLNQVLLDNEDKSLLDDRQRQRLQIQIQSIKYEVHSNYHNLCKNLEYERIFDEGCNRKRLFLNLIKIQIYSKLMRKIHHLSPFQDYMRVKSRWDQITKRINLKIQRIHEQIKQFRFYKDQFKLQYDNRHFLFEHLKKVQEIVQAFKDIKYKLYKYEHYLKNNYLDDLNLKQINYKEVIQIVQMSWIKEYAIIKKQIAEMFHNNKIEIVLKYKMILHEQEIVRNQNILSCNQIIKQEYDFKKIIIQELMLIQQKLQTLVHNLERQYESFLLTIKKMQEKKKEYVQTEKSRIRLKYERLIYEVKDSFHEVNDEVARKMKIDGEINTLNNQSKAEEEVLLSNEAVKIQYLRNKFNNKSQKAIQKIFQHFSTLKKVQANFDSEIQELCRQIFGKVQLQIDKYDKNLKALFLSYIKKCKNNDFIMGANSMNIFKQVNEEQFQQNTKGMNDIHKILSKCPQTAKNEALSNKLAIAFEQYQKQLLRVQKDYYQSKSQTQILQLIKQTKVRAQQLTPSIIIARIFAVYAIYRNIDSHQEQINFDGNPHAAQVLAILLLVDAQNMHHAKLDNKLIEVKTGEGKSRVLGGLNCYLALRGYDVYCGCYSSYLSKRDEEEFRSLFIRFGVGDTITYGAFSEHCQSLLNDKNNHTFKEVTKKVLLNEKLNGMQIEYLQKLNRLLRHEGENKRILVIDEVDVFFDEKYFGQLYTPGVAINKPEVKALMKFIWDHRNDEQLNKMTFQSEEYANLLNLFPHLKQLIKNQVQSMLHACKHYNVHPYEIRNHQIQYVDNDSVNEKLNFGYSTGFASFYQYERGKISEENYNKNTNISLIIGQFSYAQLPKYFNHIMGVSGTVEAMSEFRKKIMREDYRISEIFSLPSIYGESRRQMIPPSVCKKQDYVKALLNRIREVRKEQRPILVFFETEQALNSVSNSPQFNQFSSSIYKITQKMPPEMRNPLINYAGTRNRITLISSAFSRGTDFTVFDNDINEKGGMHVIQTYISKNYSDFIQISGRTARQGKNGSFEMMITEEDLNKNNIEGGEGMELLYLIQKGWESNDAKYGQELQKATKKAYEEHLITFDVVASLTKQNSKLIDAVKRLNYIQIKSQTVRTVIAIDGTGSMGAALNAVFCILNDTISRTEDIIKLQKPNVSFEHKIMIYRNYNIRPMDRVLQQSNFSKNSKYLEDFMSCIKPEGGLGNEAHQILFYEIGKVYEMQSIDQIIIIGDAPANNYDQMVKHRKKFHGQAVWSTKYPLLPSIEAYSQVLKKKKIPVHSFYMLRKKQDEQAIKWDHNVKQYFTELSGRTQGKSQELNIRDQNEAKQQLTDFISSSVLKIIGGQDLVQLYQQMFSKRYV